MIRHLTAAAALASIALSVAGCRTDSSIRKDLVGVWSWNPRAELPQHELDTHPRPTPELEALQLRADGTYVYVEKRPGTDASNRPTPIGQNWMEWRGEWSFAKGELELGSAVRDEDRWGAKLDAERGWIETKNVVEGGHYFRLTDLTAAKLSLHHVSIGDHDRTFHRTRSMPPRPTLGERP